MDNGIEVQESRKVELFRVPTYHEQDYYRRILKVLNACLPEEKQLTPDQMQILAYALAYEGDNHFMGTLRDKLMKHFRISTQSLSAHIKNMRDKGWLKGHYPDSYLLELKHSPRKGLKLQIEIAWEKNLSEEQGRDYRYRLEASRWGRG